MSNNTMKLYENFGDQHVAAYAVAIRDGYAVNTDGPLSPEELMNVFIKGCILGNGSMENGYKPVCGFIDSETGQVVLGYFNGTGTYGTVRSAMPETEEE